MERAGPDHVTSVGIQCGEGEQSPRFGEGRQFAEVGDELGTIEGREIAGIAELRVAERGHQPLDVLELRKAEPEVVCAEALRGDRQARRHLHVGVMERAAGVLLPCAGFATPRVPCA